MSFEYAIKNLTAKQIKKLKNLRSDNRSGKSLNFTHEVHQFIADNPNGSFIVIDKDNKAIKLKNSDAKVVLPKQEVLPSTITFNFSFKEINDQP